MESEVYTVNDVYLLKKKLNKIKNENQILKECGCTANLTRKENLKLPQLWTENMPFMIYAERLIFSGIRIIIINLNYQPHYVCAVIDLFSRKIIAYNISDKQETELMLKTFLDAYDARILSEDLMFHSDQGLQYTSYEFRKQLRDLNIIQSFSEPGCPHDNAVAEAFFMSFKSEEVYRKYYQTYEHMEASIEELVTFFNGGRPHQSFNYLTPVQVEEHCYQK